MSAEKAKADCVFCKIAAGEIHSQIAYRDKEIVVFADIAPAAPVHYQVIPIKHITSVNELESADIPLVGRMVAVAVKIAKEKGLAENGYRLVINTGADAGQVIKHLHLHILGGSELGRMA